MMKACFFDMDGLIIDSEPIQSKSFDVILREYGITPEYHKNSLIQTIGITAEANWTLLKEKYHLNENISLLLQKKRNAYMQLLNQNLKPMPGVMDLLTFLKGKNIKLAVVSSSNKEEIMVVLHGLHITNYFDVIVSGQFVKKSKPYPDIFLLAAKNLQIDPKECLVLEDSESGVIAAKAAGMKVIAVPNQYTKDHDFSKADMIVETLAAMPPLIK